MQWIDANEEDAQRRDAVAGYKGPRPVLGVCYRSECGRFRVAANRVNVPEVDRVWTVWDMTGAAPMAMMRDFRSNTAAMRAAEAMAESRGFRVALRLAALGRAVWAGVRRLTA